MSASFVYLVNQRVAQESAFSSPLSEPLHSPFFMKSPSGTGRRPGLLYPHFTESDREVKWLVKGQTTSLWSDPK